MWKQVEYPLTPCGSGHKRAPVLPWDCIPFFDLKCYLPYDLKKQLIVDIFSSVGSFGCYMVGFCKNLSTLLASSWYTYHMYLWRGSGTDQRFFGVIGSHAGPKIDILKPSQLHPHPFENRDGTWNRTLLCNRQLKQSSIPINIMLYYGLLATKQYMLLVVRYFEMIRTPPTQVQKWWQPEAKPIEYSLHNNMHFKQ
jgi:hypothetical protein